MTSSKDLHRGIALAFLLLTAATWLPAQCSSALWSHGFGALGPDGAAVRATVMWDPDGGGPLAARLVVGGEFATVAGQQVNNIAAYDLTTGAWYGFGDGVDGVVHCLHVRPNGELIAGGDFATASGATVNSLARWSGTTWVSLGGGVLSGFFLPGQVYALATLLTGDLLVGGSFLVPGNGLAIWGGVSLTSFPSPGCGVTALAVKPNGNVVAGGYFTQMVFVFLYHYMVAEWNGASWNQLTTPVQVAEGSVRALAALANGDVIAGGAFTTINGVAADNVARWNGSTWSAISGGVAGPVRTLLPQSGGAFLVGGSFSSVGPSGGTVGNVARYTGAGWAAVGTGVAHTGTTTPYVYSLTTLPSGSVAIGGTFDSAGGQTAANLAVWNGATVSPLGQVTDGKVNAVAALPNGQLLAGGEFTRVWNVPANRVALWNGSSWSALGAGVNGEVEAVARMPNGDLVAAGDFSLAGGVAANRVARWNGTSWSPLGSGLNALVRTLLVRSNGELVAGGDFFGHVRRWNGTAWVSLGTNGDVTGNVFALAQLPNGNLVAGGQITFAGPVAASRIALWNGAAWSSLGSGMDNWVLSLTSLPNGDLVAGGDFSSAGGVAANRVARWNGTVWSAMGTGFNSSVRALGKLPTGELVAGGGFSASGGTPLDHIARWNGTSWIAIDGGMPGVASNVWALATMTDGELVAGGAFSVAGAVLSPNIARLQTPCPAAAESYGAACGPHVLVPTSMPWLGTTFGAQTTCTSPCIAVAVTGFAPLSFPLASILPQGLPGCLLLVTPDLLDIAFEFFGSVFTGIALPNTPSLAGQSFHHQVVEVRFDLAGNLTALASTNALTLTIGGF